MGQDEQREPEPAENEPVEPLSEEEVGPLDALADGEEHPEDELASEQ